MRTIKFRIWNKKEKKMISSYDIWLRADGEHWSLWDWVYDDAVLACGGGYQRKLLATYAHGDSLMQYTGMQDKNGKDIYEGDIVLTTPGSFDTLYHRVVEWTDGDSFWQPLNLNYHLCEVVGNIHENPELLDKVFCWKGTPKPEMTPDEFERLRRDQETS